MLFNEKKYKQNKEAKNDAELDPALVGDLNIDEADKKKQKRGGRGNVKSRVLTFIDSKMTHNL